MSDLDHGSGPVTRRRRKTLSSCGAATAQPTSSSKVNEKRAKCGQSPVKSRAEGEQLSDVGDGEKKTNQRMPAGQSSLRKQKSAEDDVSERLR